jgi:hypothetical protein
MEPLWLEEGVLNYRRKEMICLKRMSSESPQKLIDAYPKIKWDLERPRKWVRQVETGFSPNI